MKPKPALIQPPSTPPRDSWWADPSVQQNSEAFDRAVAERAKSSWGTYGDKAAVVRILE